MASFPYLLIITLLTRYTASLQVTPNSPCASYCIDSAELDLSDPNSSTTDNNDITCYDSEYSTSSKGLKFQRCMTCLQDSTFSQGSESDQLWFLYNLRYAFDFCIFSFPNATGVASTPCATSTACGGLMSALTGDNLDAKTQDYSYCDTDSSIVTDDMVNECKTCVAATDGQDYLANFLIALDTGCKQRPATGMLLGLNETVFSKTMVSAEDPSIIMEANDKGSTLSTAQLAGIAVGAIVFILAVAGFLFVRCRKRRNRRLLLGDIRTSATGSKKSRHRPASSLSFRCQTHLTPRSPYFPHPSDNTIEEEKAYVGPFAALGSHPVSPGLPRQSELPEKNGYSVSISASRPGSKTIPLQNISTAIPTIPDNVHYSTSPKAAFFSPTDEPASTTSTKSTSQLLPLRQYNPAEFAISSPQIGASPDGMFSSPTSGSTTSPLISHAWEQRAPTWDMPARTSSRPSVGAWERVAANVSGRNTVRRTSNNGSPVETKQINFNFPPPPTRK